nr:hypothetical protein [Halalkalibacterium ligniniphilum]
MIGPKAGDNRTKAPDGEKVLLAAGARYNSALIVTGVPIVAATVVLKNAEIDDTVPSRGTTNAKSRMPPVPGDRVMVPPPIVTPSIELPNPISPPVAVNPSKTLVSATGVPDANGMIALAP